MITHDTKKILVADDSLFFRTKLEDILTEGGHSVTLAKDGQEAVKALGEHPGGTDLLILDLVMPVMDGFSVLGWINEKGLKGAFPVLIVTGAYEPVEVIERLRGLGASGFMTKEASPEEIIFRANNLLFSEKNAVKPRHRVPVSIPADFTIGEARYRGFILNLSEGGAFLHTELDLLVGTVLNLRFGLVGREGLKNLEIKGTVRWATGDAGGKPLLGGYGVMFSSIDEKSREFIAAFITEEMKRQNIED